MTQYQNSRPLIFMPRDGVPPAAGGLVTTSTRLTDTKDLDETPKLAEKSNDTSSEQMGERPPSSSRVELKTDDNDNGKMQLSSINIIVIGLVILLILGLSYYFLTSNTFRPQTFGSQSGFVDKAFSMFGESQ